MPRRRRSRNINNRRRSGPVNVPQTATVYRGPVVPAVYKQQMDVTTTVVRLDTDVVASSGGVVNNVIGSNPQSFSNWSQYAAAYDEYRVLAMEVHFEPYQRYHDAALNQSPLYIVTDRSDSAAVTSYQNALEYGSCSLHNSADRWTKSIKMSGVEDAAWIPVATGYSALYIKLYASVLTASTSIGRIASTLLVQFRGVR